MTTKRIDDADDGDWALKTALKIMILYHLDHTLRKMAITDDVMDVIKRDNRFNMPRAAGLSLIIFSAHGISKTTFFLSVEDTSTA